jgi:peptidoglycan hydrolase-like protein with peptidoglycan-binding domain
MKQGELLALGGLALLLLGGKRKVVHGTVTPLDDELVQIRPPGFKPKTPPASLEDELAAQDEGAPLEERAPYVPPPATRSDTASPPAMTDELFASVAADASLPPSTAANVPPTQKEATSPLPSPARTAPAAPVGTTEGPTDNVSPLLQPSPRGPQIPAGYDPAKAKAGAAAIASYLAKKGPAGYSREQLKTWQRHAALTPDGVYGGSTRGALIAYGVKNPPRPFFQPVATIPYVPPEQRT